MNYLNAVVETEWPRQSESEPSLARPIAELQHLEQVVRTSASNPNVGAADAGALLAGVDQLAMERAARISAAKNSMPLPLFITLVVSGLALCLNAVIVSIAGDRRTRHVAFSIILVVAIDLAALLILAGPFTGSQRVSSSPLVEVRELIVTGQVTSSSPAG